MSDIEVPETSAEVPPTPTLASNTRVIDVDIHNGELPSPRADIVTTGDSGRAPRKSRHVDFTDDGKLFEGHLTVQSRNLKSIIEYLVNNQAEQTVIIKDLQDQVNTLRLKLAKTKRGNYRTGGGGAGPMEMEDVNKRVKALESFVILWGIRPEDVAELVQDYGDPVVTPEQYSSYLLDLPSLRLMRRETRTMMAAVSQTQLSTNMVSAAMDTARRRTASRSGGEDMQIGYSEPDENAVNMAREAMDVAHDALRRVEALASSRGGFSSKFTSAESGEKASGFSGKFTSAESGEKASGFSGKFTSAESGEKASGGSGSGSGGGGGRFVDAEARAEIEELGEYMDHKLKELESRFHSSGAHRRHSLLQRKSGESTPAEVTPIRPQFGDEEVVDNVAREDAALSLEMIEELTAKVDRRFRELSSSIANTALRKAAPAPAPSFSEKGSPLRRSSTPAHDEDVEEESNVVFARNKKRRVGGKQRRTPSPQDSSSKNSNGTVTVPNGHGGGMSSSAVEKLVRDETGVISYRIDDLEEEIAKRWVAIEERLRIIGRASMSKSSGASGGVSLDRKAREDASLSLMRVQHLERELNILKRSLANISSASMHIESADSPQSLEVLHSNNESFMAPLTPPEALKDTYGNRRVQDLEKEVEQRMAEVNRAIALLKNSGDEKQHKSLMELLAAGHALLSPSRKDLDSSADSANQSHNIAGVMVLTSKEAPVSMPATSSLAALAATAAGDDSNNSISRPSIVLRSNNGKGGQQPRKGSKDKLASTPSPLPTHPTLDAFRTDGAIAMETTRPMRYTVSRLRSPNARTFGSRLVERDVLVDAALLALEGEHSSPQRRGVNGDEAGSMAFVPGQAAGDAPAAAATTADDHSGGAAPLLPLLPKETTERANPRVASSNSNTTAKSSSRAYVQHDMLSSLGHSKPCVVVNCAWCAAERSQSSVQALPSMPAALR